MEQGARAVDAVFLACIKKMMKKGNVSLRNGNGVREKKIGRDLVPIRCLGINGQIWFEVASV